MAVEPFRHHFWTLAIFDLSGSKITFFGKNKKKWKKIQQNDQNRIFDPNYPSTYIWYQFRLALTLGLGFFSVYPAFTLGLGFFVGLGSS